MTTFDLQVKGSQAFFKDVICAFLQIVALIFLVVDIWLHAKFRFLMIFAIPTGYLMFGPPVGVLLMLVA